MAVSIGSRDAQPEASAMESSPNECLYILGLVAGLETSLMIMDGDPLESWKDELTEEGGERTLERCHAKGAGMAPRC